MHVCDSPINNTKMNQQFVDPFLKKRRKDWPQEVYKGDCKAACRQFDFNGDRFIPKRFKRENIEHNVKYICRRVEEDILKMNLNLTHRNCRRYSFMWAMNSTFDIRELHLLEFGFGNASLSRSRNSGLGTDSDWPCKPRARPCAFQDATHDLPECYSSFDYNLMDWSANDQMALSFGQDVVVWRNKDDTTMLFSVKRPSSLKYSPNGKYLAIGCMDYPYPILELWEVQKGQEFLVADGKFFRKYVGAICCLEWSSDSNEILCGSASGTIFLLSLPKLKTRRIIQKHKHKVTNIRYSPNQRFLATSDELGNIFVFDGISHKVQMRMTSKLHYGITFDWHPWTGVDLVIAEKSPASIYIFHMTRREIVAYYQRKDKKIAINSINFSAITGELLVSIMRRDEEGCPIYEILVLSSLNRVVDILGNQDRGSFFMMWSPDGTRLASVGLDESFSIWNFYPEYKREELLKRLSSRDKVNKHSSLELLATLK